MLRVDDVNDTHDSARDDELKAPGASGGRINYSSPESKSVHHHTPNIDAAETASRKEGW